MGKIMSKPRRDYSLENLCVFKEFKTLVLFPLKVKQELKLKPIINLIFTIHLNY